MEIGTLLTPQQAGHTDEYLQSMAARYATPAVNLQSLFGRCCLAATPAFRGADGVDLDRLRADMEAYAERVVADPNADQLGLDPLLVAEAAVTLQKAGIEVPALNRMIGKIAEELSGQPDPVRSLGRVRLVARSLRELGRQLKSAAPHRAAADLLQKPHAWLTAPVQELTDLIDHLMADGARLDADQSDLFSLIALGELRNYRVDIASKALRLVIRQGIIEENTVEALRFVATQRRRDGGYGFANPFRDSETAAPPPDLIFHLPMTLNAVWLFHTVLAGSVNHDAQSGQAVAQ
ncbi:MAG: hypothetical protein J2P52_04280 [Blastocatellia bacterium]|nr:hypothetical protein [Blastocatellia bacterium]